MGHGQPAQAVACQRVHPRLVEHHAGREFGRPSEDTGQRMQVLRVSRTVGKGDVDAALALAEREVVAAVHGDGQDRRVVLENSRGAVALVPVSYTHLRAHETRHDLVCRLLLEKKKNTHLATKTQTESGPDSIHHQKKD
eukprot:TRINITY_DN16087_c0_g1_i2.p4 TRINITY_DN16087_c0_g1~~TRINITY_DN16087_c0_g1_i2.p4  ORF type:complete len:139 (-),score=21.26 TRINITY_DN16087_c0_g1_i2:3-419(-)